MGRGILYRGITMGKRDFKQREQKKPKKDARKTPAATILPAPPPVEVEVVRKGKKDRGEENW